MMMQLGNTDIVKKYATITAVEQKNPNEAIGMMFENAVAKKDMQSVIEVVNMAFEVFLQVKASLLFIISFLFPVFKWGITAECFHISVKTKISSTAIPRIMKIAIKLKDPK